METRKQQIQRAQLALINFKLAYYGLLDAWQQEDIDLNDLNANSLYPFDVSFDELELADWLTAVYDELEEMK